MAGIAYLSPIRWSRAASTPSRSILLSVGWPMSRQASGLAASISALVRSLIASSWAWPSRWASSMTSSGSRPAFAVLGGDEGGGLGGEHGRSVGGPSAERRHDVVVDASRARRRVGQVDEGVAGLVEGGDGGAGGGCLPGADFARDDAERPLAGAPGDAGDGLGVGGVAVQHGRGEVLAERGPGEPVVVLQVDHRVLQGGDAGRGGERGGVGRLPGPGGGVAGGLRCLRGSSRLRRARRRCAPGRRPWR